MTAAESTRPLRVPSPCVRNCCLDEANVCMGCFRTLTEICTWSESTDERRREILSLCEHRRMERSAPTGLPPPSPA